MQSYLIMMAVRLLEMKRLLKPAGSVYLHCDPTASHYLKLMMDVVFGHEHFRNEIIWAYTGPGSAKARQFNRKHDVILWYSKSGSWTFNGDAVRVAHKQLNTNRKGAAIDAPLTDETRAKLLARGKVPETWWPEFSPVGRRASERTGYPTQKPLALLERIIRASSNEGDVVLDPFCGCATALVAAERLERQWVGIDLSAKAKDLILTRMRKELGLFSFKAIFRDDVPIRTDMGKLPAYQTHKNTLYGQQEGLCAGCQTLFPIRNFTIDHIVARSRGGSDHLENLQLLCGACNSTKGSKTQEEFLATLKREGIR